MVKPDVVCLGETHISEDIQDHEIYIRNYNFLRTDTLNNRTGGVITIDNIVNEIGEVIVNGQNNISNDDVNIININGNINIYDDSNITKFDEFDSASYAEVKSIINDLDNNKGSKLDINVKIVKLVWETDPCIIMDIINQSLGDGMVPDIWKLSTITPLQKVKNSINVEDFRPINTLPILEQVLEQIVKNRLENFLESKGEVVQGL
ncbi:uncharacterized protein LOC141532668 [Cotesia typhae]|uniref:uncharacterized protein LOC141532668 n=1 Tax=Cotesia typhae TaxID=2053667 RepID=UPI003D682C95